MKLSMYLEKDRIVLVDARYEAWQVIRKVYRLLRVQRIDKNWFIKLTLFNITLNLYDSLPGIIDY